MSSAPLRPTEPREFENAAKTGPGCPECGGNLRRVKREEYCEECGLVTDGHWSDRWEGGAPTRNAVCEGTSPPDPMKHDKCMGSEILGWRDSEGNRLSPIQSQRVARLKKQQRWSRFRSKRQRNLAYGLDEVRRMGSALEITRGDIETAGRMFRQIHRENFSVGRNLDAITAAIILATCRTKRLGRTLSEVSSIARCEKMELQRTYRKIDHEFGIAAQPPQPEDYLGNIASAFDRSHPIRREAEILLNRLSWHSTVGRNPSGIAAAAFYLAAKSNGRAFTQEAVADAARVGVESLRKRLKDLRSVN